MELKGLNKNMCIEKKYIEKSVYWRDDLNSILFPYPRTSVGKRYSFSSVLTKSKTIYYSETKIRMKSNTPSPTVDMRKFLASL